jgi:hypothetical protein
VKFISFSFENRLNNRRKSTFELYQARSTKNRVAEANVNHNSTTANTKDDMFVELDDVPQQLDPYFE